MPIRGAVLDVKLSSGADLDKLAVKLRRLRGRPMQRKLHDGLVRAVRPAVPAVRRAARSIPAEGAKHTGLRDEIADATRLSVRTIGPTAGVVIQVKWQRMSEGKEELPYLMEGLARWRHPLFGNKNHWYSQVPHPYFYSTIEHQIPRIQGDIGRLLDEIAEELAR